MHLDHLLHENIKVMDGIQVNADECIVVYNEAMQQSEEGGSEEKSAATEIKFGPCLFIPEVRQTVETFAWLKTNTLSLREKRDSVPVLAKTKDDHEIEITVSISWKVDRADVLKLLAATKAPLADLIYALKLDVSKKLSSYLHNDFIKDKDPFQGTDTFPTLFSTAGNMGLTISQVNYEGYKICSSILKERNAKLKSDADEANRLKAAEEKERLNDFALEKKMARAEKQAESNLEEVNQRQKILDREHSAKLEREMKEHRQRLEQQRELTSVKAEYLRQLKENEVDLTKYMIALAMRDVPRKKGEKKKPADGQDQEMDLLGADILSESEI